MGSFVREPAKKKSNNVMLDKSLERLGYQAPRTAQTILSAIMRAWADEMDNTLLPPETKDRMNNCLISDHRNYKYFRNEFLTLIDYALRKKIIK